MTHPPIDNPDQVITDLNKLMTLNLESVEGYDNVLNDMDEHMVLTDTLREFRASHESMALALRTEIISRGGDPDRVTGWDVLADLHQTWIDIKQAVADNNTSSILAECSTGESTARSVYENVLEQEYIPDALRVMLTAQLEDIREMENRVEELEDVYEK
ncbi:MAG: PA2169 family four-helix-bundle protein [Chloroflexi bacterium]|nr:PA2169 family four-helix-bundle protein [Chloroflexota bacterium]